MPEPMNGRAIYDMCRAGGPQQAEAFERLGRYLYRVAFHHVRERAQLHDLAEDSTQEALIAIWHGLEGVESPDRFLGWAARVVINKLYDSCRQLGVGIAAPATENTAEQATRRRRVPLAKLNSLDEIRESGVQLQDVVAESPDSLPDARYARRELVELLSTGIARHTALSEQAKIVLVRGFISDWDDGMLAVALNTSRSNVQTIRSRALSQLRDDAGFMYLLNEYVTD